MAIIRTGGCSCGRLRYTVRGEPFLTGVCHCTNCRKESGSVFTVYAKWPIEAFEYQGEFSTFEGRSFCANCGSRLFNLHDADVEIRIGSLDEAPTTIAPMQEGWIKRREPWLQPIACTSQAS
ncbi:MAG: aldehyde-activating protein, partial [Hyphomicrobiales bacterium]|nr:aldehyde-activating protein [Hyphomicrobiales bacterium]